MLGRSQDRLRPIADIGVIRQSIEMDVSIAQIAENWIEFQRFDPDEAPDDVFDRGWELCNLVHDNPELAWETIKDVVSRYEENDLNDDRAEGYRILSMTAAGPLEDLLAYHGPAFIEKVEAEAKRNPRMAWTLRGVWQNEMSADVWSRVRRAGGQTSS